MSLRVVAAAPADLEPLGPMAAAGDAHWLAVRDGRPVARCTLWWRTVPALPGHRLGLIGHYVGDDEASGALLGRACVELARRGCTLALGPMDGSTWRRYRLLTERGPEPPFFLEPDNPDEWPTQFTGAGFASWAGYQSAVTHGLPDLDPRVARVAVRLHEQGFSFRRLALDRAESELRLLHGLSLAAFARNLLYTPLPEDEFLAQYRAVLPHIRPELVLLAERHGEPAAFLFAVPDLLQAKRGQAVDTFVIKTLAAHPRYAGRGLGSVLLAEANAAARRLGFRRAIHALMHDTNESTRISAREATVCRRYTLYGRTLV